MGRGGGGTSKRQQRDSPDATWLLPASPPEVDALQDSPTSSQECSPEGACHWLPCPQHLRSHRGEGSTLGVGGVWRPGNTTFHLGDNKLILHYN